MTGWALEGMVEFTMVMLLVLALRAPVARWCGAQWAYALWTLPLLLPIVGPFLPSLSLVEPAYSPVIVILPAIEPATMQVASTAPGWDWPSMLLGFWIGGAALFLSWQQSAYGAFLLHLGPSGKPAEPPLFGGIAVIESDAVDGPVAVGIFKRRIVVPVDFASRYSETERRLALEHELTHHRRFDIAWNMLALLILALNWFNPIAHAAFRAFRADQELACDASVACRSPNARRAYACAIVKSASQAGLIAAAPLNHAAFLKRRLKMMDNHGGGWGRALGGVSAFMLAGAGGLALSSPGQARSDQNAAPPVILAAADQTSAVIQPREIATLKERCNCDGKDRSDVVVCNDKAAMHDPEVRAIVERVRERTAARIAAAMPADEQMREIELAVENAQVEVAAMAESRVHAVETAEEAVAAAEPVRAVAVRQALERARVRVAAIDTHHINDRVQAAIRRAFREHSASRRLSAEERAEMNRDMAEALREAEAEMADETREAHDEIERELRHLRTGPASTH